MFISHNQARIFAAGYGSRTQPAILGIGGWIGSWELWAGPFSILSECWFTLGYDHRGTGATVAPVETITFENLVDDVFAVLDAFSVERCVLAAESAGAITALGAALRQPERITGLVIVDGLVYQEIADEDPFLKGLQADYPATIAYFVEACVPESDSDHIKRWGRQIIGRATPEAAIALYLAAGQVDLREQLPVIAQPALILHGDADRLVPVSRAQWLAGALPNAKLVVLNGAGHVPTMTRPAEVARLISDFFLPEI